jgi:Xaa-Pro aminopeptidase
VTVEGPGTLEGTGPGFSAARLLAVQARTRAAVDAIAAGVAPGMGEEEARSMARDRLSALGLRRGWHRVIVRFGPNTARGYSEPSAPGVVLGEDDLFFVDIGPVADGHEGDAGDTFVVGADPRHLAARRDVRAIWREVRDVWWNERCTGADLYRRAEALAAERGWRLHPDLVGHRLSDFPHRVHYGGGLADVAFVPAPGLWVLEIALVEPRGSFGAFYEDLLLRDGGSGRS